MTRQQDNKTTRLFIFLLPLFFILSSCDKDDFLLEESTLSFNEFSNLQNSFNPEYINKSLYLGKGNFQVNWDNYQIINFNKATNTTTYEFEVLLRREAKLQSSLFSGEIIYKLLVTEENKQNYTFNILRFEPYKTSLNKNPKINNIENYDGLKFTLTYIGKIEDIQNYEKGIVTASFKKDKLETSNNNLNKVAAIGGLCDATSFYYSAKDCADAGGSSGGDGWVIETTTHWVDEYKSLDNGQTYYFTRKRNLPNTYRWLYVFGGHDITVNSFTSGGNHSNINYPPYTGDRLYIIFTNPCAKKIFEDLVEEGKIDPLKAEVTIPNGEIKTFSGAILDLFNNSNINYTVQNGPLTNVNGSTTTKPGGVITTISDNYLVNATTLSIARTMIHEAVHAYIMLQNSSLNFSFRQAIEDYGLQNGFDINGTNEEVSRFHHEFMGQYVDAVAYSLYTWDKNYGEGGNLGWNYYQSMAFGGLFYLDQNGNIVETDSFVALIPSIIDRQEIKKVLKNEQDGNTDAKGSKCN